ncbi:aminoacetone oxidase family FAD-binding enzyme [Fluviispira multicolorata]|uniref:Aminoacetone oxidase family FAD-binding enzyme n=2 Tax=Fluviispira multicolorata TaxID=2654512 RepID=A0A833JGE7_9BACT|nr:aminoacetone oxidase family FAD-binding enzyme [Fluviispira multicolorata]
MEEWDLVVVGGGAAGYFGAIACAEAFPGARVLILEATARVLTKVKISGGGRCNVTHHQFDAKQLTTFYPRGQKELIGPFHKFQPKDTVTWFKDHGVELKVEEDGRMFPITNDSQTIINCLDSAARNSGVVLRKNKLVQKIKSATNSFEIQAKSEDLIKTRFVLLATGSMPYGVSLAANLGHQLVPPVPSLFTFQVKDPLLKDLSGISFSSISIHLKIEGTTQDFSQIGSCLITHWGLSGPAVLKLSAFAARDLHKSDYKGILQINWTQSLRLEDALQKLEMCKSHFPKKKVSNENPFNCVKRFWDAILRETGLKEGIIYSETTKKQLQELALRMTQTTLRLNGKGEFKEEFVTAGGVSREEIDFRNMESKIHSGLYFAGEAVDIDGVTGGFNFQNAWTGAWLSGQDIAKKLGL